jgi:branched-chain amino acid transport system permease protein
MNGPILRRGAGWLVPVAVLAVLPSLADDYTVGLLTTALIYAVLAVSLDLVWGTTGVIDLGHTIWFGLGALAVGAATTKVDGRTNLVTAVSPLLSRYLLGTLIGVVAAGLIALVIALWVFSFRSGGSLYVVVVTLAASVVAGILYLRGGHVTGGDNGLFGFTYQGLTARGGYWLAAVVLLVVVALTLVFVRSDYGIAMRAVRDNEERAGYLGVNALAVKTVVFVAGAVVAALAGGLYGTLSGVVSEPLFNFSFATEVLIWVAIGGRGTLVGPAVAAFGMSLATSYLNADYAAPWLLVQGVLFVFVVLFMPDGILPALVGLARRLLRLGPTTVRPRRLVPATRPVGAPGDAGREAVTVRQLHVSYGSLHILRGVDLLIRRDELLAVIGPNGAGKSTLLGVLADGRVRKRGDVTLGLRADTPHRGRAPYRLTRAGLVRKFQIPELFDSLTGAETFVLAVHRGRRLSKWRATTTVPVSGQTLEVLEASGVRGHEHRVAADLPHGLKQGLEIALAVALDPEVLLMDEPTAGLTSAERHAIGAVLRELATGGIAVVLIEHDLDFVDAVAHRVAVLHGGTVIHEGTPQTLRDSATVRTAYIGVHE